MIVIDAVGRPWCDPTFTRWPTTSAVSSARLRRRSRSRTSLTSVREKLIKIGDKLIRHGRYVAFQMAEVAVQRTLLAEVPRLNSGRRHHQRRRERLGCHEFQRQQSDRWVLLSPRNGFRRAMRPRHCRYRHPLLATRRRGIAKTRRWKQYHLNKPVHPFDVGGSLGSSRG